MTDKQALLLVAVGDELRRLAIWLRLRTGVPFQMSDEFQSLMEDVQREIEGKRD